MLKFFSRLERTRNFVLIIFAVIMVASLILFYAPSSNNPQDNLTRSDETVAKIGGERITVGEMATIMQSRGSQLPAKFLLNPLISQRIMRIEAKRLGFAATDLEVANYIRENFKVEGKPFDQARYEQNAVSQAGSVKAFEESIRDSLSAQKLEAFLTSGVTVAEEEVVKDFQRKNTKFDLTYVPVVASDLAQTITPTDEDLKAYFEKNKAAYYISVPQKKIRYIFLNTTKVGEKMTISDEDLKTAYAEMPADKKTKGVEGQEIVLRVPKPEFEQKTLERANDVISRLKKDDATIVSAETFAEAAKGFSENPATAQNGGKLSGLVKEDLNKKDDPYQQLLTMQPGEITEPISYQGRIFILRRGEAVPKTFEDAKQELEVSLRLRRAYTATAEIAQKITEDLKQTKNPEATAQKFAAEANMSVKDMVRETDFVKPGDEVANVGISAQFEQGIAALENPSNIGEKIPIKDGFAIPMLVEKRDPRDAEFADVRDKVAEAVKIEQARARVEEIAKQLATSGNAADLTNAAKAKNLKAQEQKSFILGSPLGQGTSASTNEQLEEAIYNLKVGEVTKTPVKVGDNWYVIGVTNRTEANMEEFAKQRDTLVEAKLTEKRGQVFQDYLASIRQQMESKGDIKIYQDAMAKLESDSPASMQMPQFPQNFPQQ